MSRAATRFVRLGIAAGSSFVTCRWAGLPTNALPRQARVPIGVRQAELDAVAGLAHRAATAIRAGVEDGDGCDRGAAGGSAELGGWRPRRSARPGWARYPGHLTSTVLGPTQAAGRTTNVRHLPCAIGAGCDVDCRWSTGSLGPAVQRPHTAGTTNAADDATLGGTSWRWQ